MSHPDFPSADFMPGRHACAITFAIIDKDEFRECFHKNSVDPTDADLVDFFQPMSTDDFGGKLDHVSIAKGGPDASSIETWVATLVVDIHDPDLLLKRVSEAGRQTGRDQNYIPEDVGDAIFEGWFGSNETGSPVDFGLEIIRWEPAAPSGPEQNIPCP